MSNDFPLDPYFMPPFIIESIKKSYSDVIFLKKMLLKLKTGDCWCQCGIDNPMMDGEHSEVCKMLKEYFEEE